MNVTRKGLKVLREEGSGAFIRKASLYVLGKLRKSIKSFLGCIFSSFIVKKFRKFVRNIDSIYDALNFAFSFQVFGVSVKPI
jgi:hypothetical protein